MSSTPQVAVIMAVRNCESTIQAALESALSQSLPLEIVIVDDDSTDDTIAAAMDVDWEAGKERGHVVHLLMLGQHRGYLDAFHAGFAIATAPYITKLDGDDVLPDVDALRRLHDAITAEGADYAWGDYEEVTEEGTRKVDTTEAMPLAAGILWSGETFQKFDGYYYKPAGLPEWALWIEAEGAGDLVGVHIDNAAPVYRYNNTKKDGRITSKPNFYRDAVADLKAIYRDPVAQKTINRLLKVATGGRKLD